MPESVHKSIAYIGHAFMLVLLFFSLYFCNERMLHTDNAFCTFLLLNTEDFVFSHNRYPLVITQLLPLLAIKLNLSVQAIVAAYSANFYVLYYACFLLCLYVFKNVRAALVIVFGLLVATKEIFFLQTEICHGLVFVCLFYAWNNYLPEQPFGTVKKGLYYLLGAVIFMVAVTFHPFAALFLIVIIGWDIIERKNYKDLFSYGVVFTVLIMSLLKAKLTPPDSYEGSFYKQTDTLFDTLLHLPASYTLRFFLARIVDVYAIPTAMLMAGLVWLVFKTKQYLLAGYITLATVGYLLLVAVVFKGDSDLMMERIFLVFGFMASLVFVHFVFKVLEQNQPTPYRLTMLLAVVGCLTGGSLFILKAATRYKTRLAIVSNQSALLQQQSGSKFYSTNDKFTYPYSFWANSCEQLLYSAIHYPSNLKTLYIFNDEAEITAVLDSNKNEHVFLLAPFWLKLDDAFLNKKYFNLSLGVYSPAKL